MVKLHFCQSYQAAVKYVFMEYVPLNICSELKYSFSDLILSLKIKSQNLFLSVICSWFVRLNPHCKMVTIVLLVDVEMIMK